MKHYYQLLLASIAYVAATPAHPNYGPYNTNQNSAERHAYSQAPDGTASRETRGPYNHHVQISTTFSPRLNSHQARQHDTSPSYGDAGVSSYQAYQAQVRAGGGVQPQQRQQRHLSHTADADQTSYSRSGHGSLPSRDVFYPRSHWEPRSFIDPGSSPYMQRQPSTLVSSLPDDLMDALKMLNGGVIPEQSRQWDDALNTLDVQKRTNDPAIQLPKDEREYYRTCNGECKQVFPSRGALRNHIATRDRHACWNAQYLVPEGMVPFPDEDQDMETSC